MSVISPGVSTFYPATDIGASSETNKVLRGWDASFSTHLI